MLWVNVSNSHMVVVMVTKTTLKLYMTVYNNVVSVLALLHLTENRNHFIKNISTLIYFNPFLQQV